MTDPCCFDCRFFVPDHRTGNDLTEDDWDECLPGECRRLPPALGDLVEDRYGDKDRCFGQWPKVIASDWCGECQQGNARQTAEPPGAEQE